MKSYRIEFYFSNCCSVSSAEDYSSDEEAVAKSMKMLNDDKDYFAVLVSKYTGFDEERELWTLKPIYAFDKRGEMTVRALEHEQLPEVYDKLKQLRPIYIKLKNGKWNNTIFADTLSHFLQDMVRGTEIEYITNTIKLNK